MSNWKQAKKELNDAGITIATNLKGCCLGCQDNGIPKDSLALYQLKSRWGKNGGMLCHQNLGDTLHALTVMQILSRNGIDYRWNGSQGKAIEINLSEGN